MVVDYPRPILTLFLSPTLYLQTCGKYLFMQYNILYKKLIKWAKQVEIFFQYGTKIDIYLGFEVLVVVAKKVQSFGS
jgi:hypothetical protein